MSAEFTYLKGKCPICGGHRKDCRQSNQSGMIFCQDEGANPPGYVFRGLDPFGFGMWAEATTNTDANFVREEWERKKQQQQKEKQQKLAKMLPAAERDRQYRNLPQYLSQEHHSQLRRRGLKENEYQLALDKQWVKTWQPGQIVEGISPLLPGVKQKNGKLSLVGVSGLAVAALNLDGQICGYQIASDDREKFGKYIWLSSTKHGGMPPNLPNGELPLFVWKHPEATEIKTIIYTEGSIKSLIVALWYWIRDDRKHILVVGASGANFAGSHRQVKEIIDRFPHVQCHILMPDAGSVENRNIIKNYQGLEQILSAWGKKLQVGWWGQKTKRFKKDIDELLVANQDVLINIISWEKFTPKFAFKSASKTAPQSEEPTQKAEKIPSKKDSLTWQEAFERWRKTREFTPDITLESPDGYFRYDLPDENTITVIKSGLGTGKTTQILGWGEQLKDEGWHSALYRNSLGIQFCEKCKKRDIDFKHLHEDNAIGSIFQPDAKIAACIHSQLKFPESYFSSKNILLDEVNGVVRSLHLDKNIKHQVDVLDRFTEMMKRGKRVFCLDGNAADWIGDYLSKLAPDKKLVKIQNVDNRPKAKVYLLEGVIKENGKINPNDRSPWLKQLKLLLIDKKQNISIATDSQIFAETLDKFFSELGVKILRNDSKTQPDLKDSFMKNPDAYIKQHQPQLLIYTSTMESGMDITIQNYFAAKFEFFFGVLCIDAYLQMMERVRDLVPHFLWCTSFGGEGIATKSFDEEEIGRAMIESFQNDIKDCFINYGNEDLQSQIITKLIETVRSFPESHLQALKKLYFIRNFESANMRECLLYALEKSGYPITLYTANLLHASEELNDQTKKKSEQVKRQNCKEIFEAEKIEIEDIDEEATQDGLRWEERVKVIQAIYRQQLPRIEKTPRWTENFIYKIRYDDRKFIYKQQLFWLFNNIEIAQRMQQERWNKVFFKGEVSPERVNLDYAKVKALRDVGLNKIIDNPEAEYTNESPEIMEIVEACQDEKIILALDRKPGKLSAIKFVGMLLEIIGLGFQSRRERRGNGLRIYLYKLNEKLLKDLDRVVVQDCLDKRWEKYTEGYLDKLHWSAEDLEFNVSPVSENQPEEAKQLTIDLEKVSILNPDTSKQDRPLVKTTKKGGNAQQQEEVKVEPGQAKLEVDAMPSELLKNRIQTLLKQTDPDPLSELIDLFGTLQNRDEILEIIALADDFYSRDLMEGAIIFHPLKWEIYAWIRETRQEEK